MVEPVRLHQAIHGYSEGHTLLGSSLRLGKRDARTMLILSDLAGSGGTVGESGYLCGYPLPESGRYVLAKTWLAPEMRRPGCVWTHSLIIEPAQLDLIARHAASSGLFVRPETGRYEEYKIPAIREFKTNDRGKLTQAREGFVRAIISALYMYPSKSVFLTDEDLLATEAVLAVWEQQWPSLKANFRFCTSVASDRSTNNCPFDLQVVRKGTRNPSSFLKTSLDINKLRLSRAPWIDAATHDLVSDEHDLSEFFADCGPFVDGNRNAFVPMTTLFCFLDGATAVAEQDVIQVLHHPAVETLPRHIKLGVIKRAVTSGVDPSDQATALFLDHLELFDPPDIAEISHHLGRLLVRKDLRSLLTMWKGTTAQASFASQVIDCVSLEDLAQAVLSDPAHSEELLRYRTDLLSSKQFVAEFPDVWLMLSLAANLGEDAKKDLVETFIRSGRSDIDAHRLRSVDPSLFWNIIKSTIDSSNDAGRESALDLIRVLCNDIGVLTKDLAAKHIVSTRILDIICRTTKPDQILNDYGADPWLFALNNVTDQDALQDEIYVMAYSLCRGLGWRTREPLELIHKSLGPVYSAAKSNNLPHDAWNLLDDKLRSGLISRWDICKRIRRSVSERFISKGRSPSVYASLPVEDGDFAIFAEETEDQFGGRTYLKDVRRYLRHQTGDSPRLKIVERVLG